MGLDSVELVLSVEREWELEIPDAAAERMRTVGDMYWYVLERLTERARAAGGPAPDPAAVWARLVDIIATEIGVERERVRPEASFIEDLGVD
jgi:acyl carrier protein